MEARIDIDLRQLIKIIKALPKAQLDKLMVEAKKFEESKEPKSNLEELLLKGPVATEEQIDIIAKNRRAINKWRN